MKEHGSSRLATFTAIALLALNLGAEAATSAEPMPPRPNILWLIGEDLGRDLGCHGDPDARTPNLDRLAAEGRIYRRAYSTGNVCSPSWSAFCTGMYQTALDAQN